MTLVLLEKGLVLEGWPSKIEVIWALGICTHIVRKAHNRPHLFGVVAWKNQLLASCTSGQLLVGIDLQFWASILDKLLMEEMWRSPVEVGSLSMFIPLFTGFYTSRVVQDFLDQQYFLLKILKGLSFGDISRGSSTTKQPMGWYKQSPLNFRLTRFW